MPLQPFHLAIPVRDLATCRTFYTDVLGCTVGRSANHWVDLNLFGHQLVLHQVDGHQPRQGHNPVDGESVPVPHFGVVLAWEDWEALANRIGRTVTFVISPTIRFEGEPGEQATMFFTDPEGNALEFKAMRKPENLFAT